jgi:hypothetical protein
MHDSQPNRMGQQDISHRVDSRFNAYNSAGSIGGRNAPNYVVQVVAANKK